MLQWSACNYCRAALKYIRNLYNCDIIDNIDSVREQEQTYLEDFYPN